MTQVLRSRSLYCSSLKADGDETPLKACMAKAVGILGKPVGHTLVMMAVCAIPSCC